MQKKYILVVIMIIGVIITGFAQNTVRLTYDNLTMINREIVSVDEATNSVTLNNQRSDGLAIIKDVSFEKGTIDIEIKGENIQGRSFVGVAFNIQNDSTYEAIYFRPFNFQAEEQIRREHSLQYIFHPKNTWRYLRTNHEGQYESTYPRQPSPDEWFRVQVKIDDKHVKVYDHETNTLLLSIERLTKSVTDKIALWTGFNSKGQFKNLRISS